MSAVAAGAAPARRSKLKFGPLWLAVAGLAFLAAAVGISFVLRGLFLTIVALDLRKFGP